MIICSVARVKHFLWFSLSSHDDVRRSAANTTLEIDTKIRNSQKHCSTEQTCTQKRITLIDSTILTPILDVFVIFRKGCEF